MEQTMGMMVNERQTYGRLWWKQGTRITKLKAELAQAHGELEKRRGQSGSQEEWKCGRNQNQEGSTKSNNGLSIGSCVYVKKRVSMELSISP